MATGASSGAPAGGAGTGGTGGGASAGAGGSASAGAGGGGRDPGHGHPRWRQSLLRPHHGEVPPPTAGRTTARGGGARLANDLRGAAATGRGPGPRTLPRPGPRNRSASRSRSRGRLLGLPRAEIYDSEYEETNSEELRRAIGRIADATLTLTRISGTFRRSPSAMRLHRLRQGVDRLSEMLDEFGEYTGVPPCATAVAVAEQLLQLLAATAVATSAR